MGMLTPYFCAKSRLSFSAEEREFLSHPPTLGGCSGLTRQLPCARVGVGVAALDQPPLRKKRPLVECDCCVLIGLIWDNLDYIPAIL